MDSVSLIISDTVIGSLLGTDVPLQQEPGSLAVFVFFFPARKFFIILAAKNMGHAKQKCVFGHMRTAKPRSVCTSTQSHHQNMPI